MSNERTLPASEKIRLGAKAGQIKGAAGTFGLVLMLIALVLAGVGGYFDRFLHSYLVSFTFYLSMALGALFFVVLHHLVGAKWSTSLRRVAEAITATFPLLFILSAVIWVPIVLGNSELYPWTDEQLMANDHLLHKKASYLNDWFFAGRVILYFAIWIGTAHFFFKSSTDQDEDGSIERSNRMQMVSAPAMIVFAFTCAFAGFDLLMTLQPHWFSTMYGVYYFAGCAISIMALLALIPMALQKGGHIRTAVTVEHYHDVGKLLFAFVFFWGYIAFSQFMLIWAANIPEETGFFYVRWFAASPDAGLMTWKNLTIALILFHFLFPFVILMSRHTKRRLSALAGFAAWMLVWHWVDLYWQVMPAYNDGELVLHPIDFLIVLGMGALFFAAVIHALGRVNLVAVKDPNLSAGLAFENQ